MNKMECDLHEMINLLIDYANQVASSEKVKLSRSVNLVGNYSKGKGKGKKKPKKNPHAPKGVLNKPKGKENAADHFTKALGSKEFDKHKWKIGLKFMTD
ncbi:hypothetical protein L6164_025915 [Bauhinia variegata]|uniref:Uncharacterized protein n=1 Tax=Bauhinia variegata TaxID=167791 RepID=A0ACB9M3L9_BAUVA|nr:hypothetical protein L6164_025915 [Bauhinia variegata]